jgi:hypothetical protein
MMRPCLLASAALCAVAAPAALAQSDLDLTNKYTWSENTGFFNWRDAGDPAASQGVRLSSPDGPTFLSGRVWSGNLGWITLGDGTPADGLHYANLTGADFGVNIGPTGNLSGYAWSENAGWINFSGGALASPANPARYDAPTLRFRGHAWGENIGWINLDHATVFAGLLCPADYNQDGFVDGIDYDQFNNDFESFDPVRQMHADFNRDGFVDGIDYDQFNNDFASFDPVQQMKADFYGDGFVDGIDYDLFNNHFAVGC